MDPIERVREGMRVLDATGSSVGTVAEVRFNGRGGSKETSRSPDHDRRLSSHLSRGTANGQAQPRARGELIESIGYVMVEAGGPLGDRTHFSGDDIIAVQSDTVHITHRAKRPAPRRRESR